MGSPCSAPGRAGRRADCPDRVHARGNERAARALDNQLQRAVNLCLGAALSTIGLTVPAVLGIGLITGQPVILGLDLAEVTLLALPWMLSTITFSGARTTVLQGAVHLVLFFVYLVLIFSP